MSEPRFIWQSSIVRQSKNPIKLRRTPACFANSLGGRINACKGSKDELRKLMIQDSKFKGVEDPAAGKLKGNNQTNVKDSLIDRRNTSQAAL